MYIYIYYRFDHPSDYCMKITIDKRTRSNEGYGLFSSYKGSIEITDKNILEDRLSDKGIHTGTILCDEDMDRAIQNNGLVGALNVLYGNSLGRGFCFWNDNNY